MAGSWGVYAGEQNLGGRRSSPIPHRAPHPASRMHKTMGRPWGLLSDRGQGLRGVYVPYVRWGGHS